MADTDVFKAGRYAWGKVHMEAESGDPMARCIVELCARSEALEAGAAEPAQQHPIKTRIGVLDASIKASMDRIQALVADLPEPPLPPADRPLWEVMSHAYYPIPPSGDKHDWADAIDAVATWLERRYLDRYPGAAELLRNEARRTREGA